MPAPWPDTIPDGYLLTLDIVGGFSLPVNLLAIYMTWFQSPGMQGYKYCLTYMQISSYIVELSLSWMCPAYWFLPLTGGIAAGDFFRKFISNHTGVTIWIFMFCFVLPALLSCFVYRHNAASNINQNNSTNLQVKKLLLILTHIFPFLTAIGTWNCRMTFQQKYEYVLQNYPQCLFWLAFDKFEAYDHKKNPWIVVTASLAIGFVFSVGCYCIGLGIHTMLILQRLRAHMSAQTYQMHLTALVSLALQMITPLVYVLPVYVIVVVVLTDAVELQGLIAWSPCLMSTHSIMLCTVMILSNGTYRKILKEKVLVMMRLTRFTDSQVGSAAVEPSMRTSNNLVGSTAEIL